MIPKRILLENFLSFGDPAVEFAFDNETLWALCGPNGIGKSAVFDGITYCLYGVHRGGAVKSDQLIRHGSNGFRVVFEFEFAGADYRVTRTRTLRGRTTQKLERFVDGAWAAVDGVNGADDIKGWVEQTLGLRYDAFTTSVLLRQGEADKLFSASRDERIAVLKRIIGFEQFEAVSGRVHAAALCRASALEAVRVKMKDAPPVTPEELEAAEAAAAAAESKRNEAQAAHTAAGQRVERARRWATLEAKRLQLQQQLAEAERRAAGSEAIRTAKARLDDLGGAVPVLHSLVSARDKVAAAGPRIERANADREEVDKAHQAAGREAEQARQREAGHKQQAETFERKAKDLGEEIERGNKFLELIEHLDKLKRDLAAHPPDLAEQLTRVESEENAADEARKDAVRDLAVASERLRQARESREKFADVAAGARCSRCGQLVDEAHAAKERERLGQEVAAREAAVAPLEAAVASAEKASEDARKRRKRLQKEKTAHDKIAAELAGAEKNLKHLGANLSAAEHRARLAELGREKESASGRAAAEVMARDAAGKEAKRLEKEAGVLKARLEGAAEVIRVLDGERIAARSAYDTDLNRLAEHWRSRLPDLTAEAVRELAAELEQLQTSGIAQQFELLRQDEQQRAQWVKQLAEVGTEIEAVPADDRVGVADAECAVGEAEKAARGAGVARDEAVRQRDQLKDRADRHAKLKDEMRRAEREYDLHKKLDELLGQGGLQRELVRDAEHQIVALANETLDHLSGGELSLEPDEDVSARDDKAFALRARRADDPFPVGVAFLSGSQKFRVAVSLALAVGRFASGRARPLESVVIDEGFGSLDEDGLLAMAEELKRLHQSQSLRRVILVSHQSDFTDRFPVGYLLTRGDKGTTAAPFRR